MEAQTASEQAHQEQTRLVGVTGIAVGSAKAVEHQGTATLPSRLIDELSRDLNKVIEAGESAVEASREYLDTNDEGKDHTAECLRANLTTIKQGIHFMEVLTQVRPRLTDVPHIDEFWPAEVQKRLERIADELDDIAETLALSLDEEFHAAVVTRIDEAKHKGVRHQKPGGAGTH